MRPSDWIAKPRVRIDQDKGLPPSAYIRLRRAAPAYTIQPNPECRVYFHLGADHWPVAIEMRRPVPGRFSFDVLVRLIEGADGKPQGAAVEPNHKFIPLTQAEFASILRAMDAAQTRLEEASA